MRREGIRGHQRQSDRGIEVAGDGIRELFRINLPPSHGLLWRRAGQAARVGTGIRNLQEVVVATLREAQDFLNLRLRLQNKILGRAPTQNEDSTLTLSLGVKHDGRAL